MPVNRKRSLFFVYITAFILLLVGKRLLQTIVWYRRGEASGAALMCTVGVFGSVLIALIPFVIHDLDLVPGYDFLHRLYSALRRASSLFHSAFICGTHRHGGQ